MEAAGVAFQILVISDPSSAALQLCAEVFLRLRTQLGAKSPPGSDMFLSRLQEVHYPAS